MSETQRADWRTAKRKMAKSKPGINSGESPKFNAEQLALQLHLNISHRQVAELKQLAQAQDRTVSYMIRAAIEAMITANQSDSEKP